MHIAAHKMATEQTIPALKRLRDASTASRRSGPTWSRSAGLTSRTPPRLLISNYLHSALIMADMCDHFRRFMIEGAQLNQARLKENIDRSVMMVTALSPVIG
jgi:fumarate hydratase class II